MFHLPFRTMRLSVVAIALLAGGGALSAAEIKPSGPAGGVAASSHQTATTTHKLRPIIGVRAPLTAGVSKLTQGECTQLGGDVKDSSPGVCNSNKVCVRVDQNNKVHRVCITKT